MVQYHRGLTSNNHLTFECGEKKPLYIERPFSEKMVCNNGWSREFATITSLNTSVFRVYTCSTESR